MKEMRVFHFVHLCQTYLVCKSCGKKNNYIIVFARFSYKVCLAHKTKNKIKQSYFLPDGSGPISNAAFTMPSFPAMLIIRMICVTTRVHFSHVFRNGTLNAKNDRMITSAATLICSTKGCWFEFLRVLFCFQMTNKHYVAGHPMITSSNGNIFRVTGHLCREFPGHRWIPRKKASGVELWCFLWSVPE